MSTGHSIIKKGMLSLQPLDLSFDMIRKNLETFDEMERKEKNEVGILVHSEPRLRQLIGKVSHYAPVAVRCELLREASDIEAPCTYRTKIFFGLPCFLELQYTENIDLNQIPTRWTFKQSEDVTEGRPIDEMRLASSKSLE